MKKRITIIFLLTAALSATATTWTVAPGDTSDFSDIQSAVNAASAGDIILVAPNYYYLTAEIGVTKALTIRSQSGPDSTIIDGGGSVRCFNLADVAVVLDGLTITNGYTTGNGGGIYCDGTTPEATNCIISGNSATYGGGMHKGTANNCTISGNSATGHGGGMFYGMANNCTIIGNSAYIAGGMNSGTANNCTIIGNSAVTNGGGMSSGIANNSVIYSNSGGDLSDSIAHYSCSPEMTAGVDGNITNAPLFVNAAAGDYRLQTNSPCIDAGTNAYAFGSTDLQGNNPRIFNGTVDMGAYEYADSDGDGLRNEDDPDADGDGFDNAFETARGWSTFTSESNLLAYIHSHSAAFGIYSSNAVLSVADNEQLLNAGESSATLSLQLETSTDLLVWTNAATPVERTLSVPAAAEFFRVRPGR